MLKKSKGDEQAEHRGFSDPWNNYIGHYNDRYMSLYICQKPENGQHQEWTLKYVFWVILTCQMSHSDAGCWQWGGCGEAGGENYFLLSSAVTLKCCESSLFKENNEGVRRERPGGWSTHSSRGKAVREKMQKWVSRKLLRHAINFPNALLPFPKSHFRCKWTS